MDELEADLQPASLSKCSVSNQMGLVHQDWGWGSNLSFHLMLVSVSEAHNFIIRQ